MAAAIGRWRIAWQVAPPVAQKLRHPVVEDHEHEVAAEQSSDSMTRAQHVREHAHGLATGWRTAAAHRTASTCSRCTHTHRERCRRAALGLTASRTTPRTLKLSASRRATSLPTFPDAPMTATLREARARRRPRGAAGQRARAAYVSPGTSPSAPTRRIGGASIGIIKYSPASLNGNVCGLRLAGRH